jgi:DNA mismatch endonuclease, patch repair protein
MTDAMLREMTQDGSHPTPSSAAATATMKANRRRDTAPELRLRRELHSRGMRFRVDHAVITPSVRTRPDVVFPRAKIAVFVDGCFWHRCPIHGTQPTSNARYWQEKLDRNVRRDRTVDRALEAAGWRTIRVWEHADAKEAADLVEAAVRQT